MKREADRLSDHKFVRLSDDHPSRPRTLELSMLEAGPVLSFSGMHHIDLSAWKPDELARFLAVAAVVVDEMAALKMLQQLEAVELLKRWAKAGDGLIHIDRGHTGFSEYVEGITAGFAKGFPLSGVWLGVSVENQAAAAERIPLLLKTPAAVRFLSCEPLLGYVDISFWTHRPCGWSGCGTCGQRPLLPFIDWVIAGGESGAGARPLHPSWVRLLRDVCAADNVAFFFKQWGEYRPCDKGEALDLDVRDFELSPRIAALMGDRAPKPTSFGMVRVGKKTAGSLLDGVEHKAFPRGTP